jgi:hypothetical protein
VRLQVYIDAHMPEWSLAEIDRAHRLLSELDGRVTRMRVSRDRMEGVEDDVLIAAVNEALDSISEEWDVEL